MEWIKYLICHSGLVYWLIWEGKEEDWLIDGSQSHQYWAGPQRWVYWLIWEGKEGWLIDSSHHFWAGPQRQSVWLWFIDRFGKEEGGWLIDSSHQYWAGPQRQSVCLGPPFFSCSGLSGSSFCFGCSTYSTSSSSSSSSWITASISHWDGGSSNMMWLNLNWWGPTHEWLIWLKILETIHNFGLNRVNCLEN